MQPTRVLVRVQAKGGRFLGDSHVILLDLASGKLLAEGRASGGPGQLSDSFSPAATRQSVVTPMPGTHNVLWLSATPGETAGLTATFGLNAPTLVEFVAEALTDGIRNGHAVTQKMWITPGVDLTAEPGVVLVMPGLDVRILTARRVGEVVMSVSASVSMMCGGTIDPRFPWLPSEFSVRAAVADTRGRIVAEAPLAFQVASTFGAAGIALPGPGTYRVTVSASQPAEGNVGSASTLFELEEFPYY